MKMAISAMNFQKFDPDHNKSIEAPDIVRVLAAINIEDLITPGMEEEDAEELRLTAQKAHALALTILRDQKIDGNLHGAEFYTFADYMDTQDNGSIPFSDFIKLMRLPTGKFAPSEEEVKACEIAFQEGQRASQATSAVPRLKDRSENSRANRKAPDASTWEQQLRQRFGFGAKAGGNAASGVKAQPVAAPVLTHGASGSAHNDQI